MIYIEWNKGILKTWNRYLDRKLWKWNSNRQDIIGHNWWYWFNKPIIRSNNFGHSEKKIVIPIGTNIGNINTNDNKPYVKILEKFWRNN